MEITTDEFGLSKDEYFGLLASELLRRRWLVIVGLAALAIYTFVFTNIWVLGLWFAFCAVFYPLYILFFIWRFVGSHENRMIYLRQHYQFDDNFMYAQTEDGSDSNIRYEHVTRVVLKKRHYLLYISKSQFICVPFRVFKSAEDHAAFETLLRNHNLM